MNSPNPRTVHNRRAAQLICRLLDWRKWDELKLAETSGILPGVISAHLSGQRPIRPQHLAAYLRVLDRQERSALLDAWLQDNVDYQAIANLLDGTKTSSMPAVEQNRWRMLDWWAMAIASDSKIAKIFHRFNTKAAFNVPLELVSLASMAAVQFQGWLLEKVYSLFTRVKHATVAVVSLVLALCQPGKVTQQAGELAEQGGAVAGKAVANSLFAASFLAPAIGETTNFNVDSTNPSPPPASRPNTLTSRGIVKRVAPRQQSRNEVAPARRIQRTVDHEWRRLLTARKDVHNAFARLIRDAHPRQSKQTHRKQRRT